VIVTLGQYQSRVVMTRIPELHATAMAEHREVHGPRSHYYDLPAIAWRQIRDHLWLNPAYYGPLGGKLDTQPHALYRAIQIVHKAVLEMEHHPALEHRAVMGAQMNVIPAFIDPLGVRSEFSPYPFTVEGIAAFVLLVPDWSERHGQQLTQWKVAEDPNLVIENSWTFRPHSHLDFLNAKV
jgi:hypothetical protein